MADQTLPGRPGNLTVEQEAKLRELWVLAAQIGGIFDSVIEDGAGEEGDTAGKNESEAMSEFVKRVAAESGETDPTKALHILPSGKIAINIKDDQNVKHSQNELFNKAVASISPEQFRTSFWSLTKHEHPDAFLLRFLRARKWDVSAAMIMAISALQWRLEFKVETDLLLRGEESMLNLSKSTKPGEEKEGREFMTQLKSGKAFSYGVDRHGRPICITRARLHHMGHQSQLSMEHMTVYLMEHTRLLLQPPADCAVGIFDMTGFGITNMDYHVLRFMTRCFEANYPESLKTMIFWRAPFIFQGFWRVIKGWLDPDVAKKIMFANKTKDLEEWIEPQWILKDFGGENEWEYKYIEPEADENKCMEDKETREQLEVRRRELAQEYEVAVALCVLDKDWENQRNEHKAKRGEIAEKLAENYWKLDPYIRARSFYDRTGAIQGSTKGKGVS